MKQIRVLSRPPLRSTPNTGAKHLKTFVGLSAFVVGCFLFSQFFQWTPTSAAQSQTPGAIVSAQPAAFPTPNFGGIIFGHGYFNSIGFFKINPDGTNRVALTDLSSGAVHNPSVSTQTGMIAFEAASLFGMVPSMTDPAQGSRIFVMNGDGSGIRQLTFAVPGTDANATGDFNPSISPDGSKVAFVSKRNTGSQFAICSNGQILTRGQEVWVVDTDGTGLRQVTFSEDHFAATGDDCGRGESSRVSWMADSQHFVVAGTRPYKRQSGDTRLGFPNAIEGWSPTARFSILYADSPNGDPVNRDRSPDDPGKVAVGLVGSPDWLDVDANNRVLFHAGCCFTAPDGLGFWTPGTLPVSYAARDIVMGKDPATGDTGNLNNAKYAPDPAHVLIYGSSPFDHVFTLFIDNYQHPLPGLGNFEQFNYGMAWAPGSPMPAPNNISLTPNPIVLYNHNSVQIDPAVLDAQGNPIVHTGLLRQTDLCSNCQLQMTTGSHAAPGFSGLLQWEDSDSAGTLCVGNAGLRSCVPFFNSKTVPVLSIAASQPVASIHTATPGVFTITRDVSSKGALAVNFALGGTATRDVDYTLSVSGNSFTIPDGQSTFTINVQPTGTSFGKGDKTVSLTLQQDPANTFYVDSLKNSATVTVKDDGAPPPVLTLTSISPNRGGDTGPVTATISGANIKSGAAVKLRHSGLSDIAGANVNVGTAGTFMTATFDLTNKQQGVWDVVVINPDNATKTLTGAFTIEASVGPDVWVDVVGRYTMRSDLTQTFYIAYGNRGDVNAPPTRLTLFIPSPMAVSGYPILHEVPGQDRGTLPNVTQYTGGTMLEFYVASIPANSSSSAPFLLTAPVELLHSGVDLRIEALSSPHPDPSQAQVDSAVTLTPEYLEETDTHAKVVQHVKKGSFSGDFTTNITVQDTMVAHDPVINITNDGQTVRWQISVTVPKSLLISGTSGQAQPKSASAIKPNITEPQVELLEEVFEGGEASVDTYFTALAAIEAKEALEKGIEFDELATCLNKMGRISDATLDAVKRADSARNIVRVSTAAVSGGNWIATLAKKGSPVATVGILAVEHGVINPMDKLVLERVPLDVIRKDICSGQFAYLNTSGKDYAQLCFDINQSAADSEANEKARQALFDQLAADCLEFEFKEEKAKILREARELHLGVIASGDPNDKSGPQGAGTQQYITGKQPLRYVISFENIATATAPAQTIVITDQLDPAKVDLSTFSLGAFSFNTFGGAPPPGLASYTTDVDLRPRNNLIVRVNAQLDQNSGLLTWRFTSIDPATGQPTTEPTAGFLPPDKNPPEGQGSIVFSVMPKTNLPHGTEIRNKARIVFDNNAPIDTPEWLNTIDNSAPSSKTAALGSTQSFLIFNVSWGGADTGSGVRDYTVYVSANGGSYTVWLNQTTATSAYFIGQPGKNYAFYTIATDQANNQEAVKTASEAATAMRGDITNAIDDSRYFVWDHYGDFLGRIPDQSGFDFWTNQIESCGTNVQCREVTRINVSASFFLSIEFQQTGYLVERFYKSAYGSANGTSTLGSAHQLPVPIIRRSEFLGDAQEIGQGVVVLQTGWEQKLEANKQAFALEFVQRGRFVAAFPTTLTPAQFVDRLFANAGVTPSATDRSAAISEFGSAADTSDFGGRARALRRVAENSIFAQQEFNRAFVLMQYFGYLRRNPNDTPEPTLDYTGYDFWLTKLNQFDGDYLKAEMVKAFISSPEYRKRFGP